MDKPLACFEISDDSIKLLVGYELSGQPIVLYTKEAAIPGLVKEGRIADAAGLAKALAPFHTISDEVAKLKISISEACLLLPPLGLQVYQNNKTTNVVSPEGTIAKLDIANVVSLVNKETVPNGNEIVDIIPDEFVLDKGQRFVNPPLGEQSNSLTIKAKVHSLPHAVAYEYRSVLNQAGFHIKKSCVSTYCYAELYKAYKDLPESYVLLDIGSKITTLSLIGDGSPFASLFFTKGSSDLSQDIADAFQIDLPQAEMLKETYGYDPRQFSFDPTLCSGIGESGEKEDFYQKDLNQVILDFYDPYEKLLENAINSLLSVYGDKFDSLPLLLTGGGAKLAGLSDLLTASFPKRKIILGLPRSIGARDSRYAALLGLLLAASRYKGSLEDNFHGVITVSRKNSKGKDEGANGDDVL